MKTPPEKTPEPIRRGEVAGALVTDLLDCFTELEARRKFDEQIAEWFRQNPKLSERFARFQSKG